LLLWQPAVKDMRSRVCRSTLADASEVRDWRIYADLAALLIKKARRLYSASNWM
jgi:hypothetical protein